MIKALAVQLMLERAGIWSVVDESWDMIADLTHALLVRILCRQAIKGGGSETRNFTISS
jgi:hypothetical protein